MLNISKRTDGKKLTITVEGRLDTTSAPQLEEIVRSQIGDAETLIFDFEKLDYISSAGLRVLLAAQMCLAMFLAKRSSP